MLIPSLCAKGARLPFLPTETQWSLLRGRLQSLMRRLLRHFHDVEDIVAETLQRVLIRFPSWPSWDDVWAWASRVARNLLASALRMHRRRRTVFHQEQLDELQAPDAAHSSLPLTEGVQAIRLRARQAERETLDLLVVGVVDLAQIAAARRVTTRAARAALYRLRDTAAAIGNISTGVSF